MFVCGVVFERRARGGRAPLTCYSDACRRERNRRWIAEKRGSNQEHFCRWCGSSWVNIRGGSRHSFCSTDHKRSWELADKRARYESHPDTGRAVDCAECGTEFVRVQPNQIVCSARCRRRRSGRLRAAGRGHWAPTASLREAVWIRDDGICQLCDVPIPDGQRYDGVGKIPDWYPTLDHVVPRSKGGSNDIENLQLAHWICNVLKGASVGSVLPKAG